MKKEIIIWQIIVVVLGLSLIFTIRVYLQDKIKIEAATNRANCIAVSNEKGLKLEEMCIQINQNP